MTGYNRGDVVLASFIFPDESGQKQRPIVIVSTGAYHQSRGEAIALAITSNTERTLAGDHLIQDWHGAGLLFPSVVTGLVRTIKQNMIIKKLGGMSGQDMASIEDNMRAILGL